MAIQLGLSAADPPVDLRHGGDRRQGDRRARPRGTPDRRRGARRRATLRSLLFTTLTLGFPQHLSPAAFMLPLNPLSLRVAPALSEPFGPRRRVEGLNGSRARVTTAIDSFVVIPPWRAYNDLIRQAATRYELDPALVRSVMQVESAFNPIAVSSAGAMGLMQLMPDLAAEFGVIDPFDPEQNVMAGARYLRQLLDMHSGNVRLAVASYNAGPGAVARYGHVPPYEETREYVKRVTQLLARARKAAPDRT